MKKTAILPLIAVLALGVAACSKTAEPTNATTETNTIIEDSDANLSAVDAIDTSNSGDALNIEDANSATENAL